MALASQSDVLFLGIGSWTIDPLEKHEQSRSSQKDTTRTSASPPTIRPRTISRKITDAPANAVLERRATPKKAEPLPNRARKRILTADPRHLSENGTVRVPKRAAADKRAQGREWSPGEKLGEKTGLEITQVSWSGYPMGDPNWWISRCIQPLRHGELGKEDFPPLGIPTC